MFWTRSFLELRCVCVCVCVCVRSAPSFVSNSATLWTEARQAPLSMGFSRQENWSGLPCLPPGDLPDAGIKPTSPVSSPLQVYSLLPSHRGSPEVRPWYSWDRKHCPKKLHKRPGSFGALIWILIVMGWRWGDAETLSQAPSPTNCDSVTFSSFKAFCRLESAKHAF